MSKPEKYRLRRTMMFLNCQKPGLIKDPYVYKPDSIMLDLEDAVAEKEKDAAFSAYLEQLQSHSNWFTERYYYTAGETKPIGYAGIGTHTDFTAPSRFYFVPIIFFAFFV